MIQDGPPDGPRLVLAHGAGAPMDSAWMNEVAGALGAAGVRVTRFNFPYMARGKGPPDKEPVLRQTWLEVIEQVGRPLFIGGKSMGGRIATMVADEAKVSGLVCLGYPFHPPGRAGKLRTAHLEGLHTPCLICQGERDPFGTRAEVEGYRLASQIRLLWVPDGDHSLEPRKKSGHDWPGTLAMLVREIAGFVGAL